MTFYINNTLVTISNYFQPSINTQILPFSGYQNTGISLSNFILYMFGTRTKCNYQYKDTDLSYFCQKDIFNRCFDLGAYTMSPWNLTNMQFSNARWIWASANANTDASGNLDGYYYWFYYTFYYNSNTSGTFYIACDKNSTVFFNGEKILTLANDLNSNSLLNSIPISITNGLNYIRIAAYNAGSSAKTITYTNGIKTTSDTRTIYTFTLTSGSITFSGNINIELLVVGGGGGGGQGLAYRYTGGGGGGGGQVYYNNNIAVTSSQYTIVAGAGGLQNQDGGQSSFGSYIAVGGTKGVVGNSNTGGSGGNSNTNTGGSGAVNYIYGGGGGGGGGAGAGGNGNSATLFNSLNGGIGGTSINSSISGASSSYGGGGGGGGSTIYGGSIGGSMGGSGGGGNNNGIGGAYQNAGGNSTQFGGGGGGGGGSYDVSNKNGGNGRNGIVIISVSTSDISPNPAGLICSVYDSTVPIANSNTDWAYSLSTTAGTSTTTNYSTSGANQFNSLT
jgi:hypothetical protein